MAAEMNALAGVGKLADLDVYLARARPPEKPSAARMLATLQDAAARSGAMTIRLVEE